MTQSRERTRTWPEKTLTRRDFIDLASAAGAGAACVAALGLVGCSGADDGEVANGEATSAAQTSGSDGDNPASAERPSWSNPEVGGNLVHTGSLDLAWATGFTVDLYEGDRALACIADGTRYLFVPAGDAPQGIAEDVTVLERPLSNIYLASSSTLCLFAALGAVDCVSHVSVTQETCTVEAFTQAIASGDIVYGGKYSAPDYEAFLNGGCRLAVENTMIYHTPEVKEQLERLGIPVFVERSSYERHPLGRMEWVKVYGALLGRDAEAEELYRQEIDQLQGVLSQENTGKTVAFFSINSNGSVTVRKSGDYIARTIELAGGRYIFPDLGADDSAVTTLNMQMEAFYDGAIGADILIYNSTINGQLSSLDELIGESVLLSDFPAVQEGRVWCTSRNLFQETMRLGGLILDIHSILTEENPDSLRYLYPLQ